MSVGVVPLCTVRGSSGDYLFDMPSLCSIICSLVCSILQAVDSISHSRRDNCQSTCVDACNNSNCRKSSCHSCDREKAVHSCEFAHAASSATNSEQRLSTLRSDREKWFVPTWKHLPQNWQRQFSFNRRARGASSVDEVEVGVVAATGGYRLSTASCCWFHCPKD